MFQKRDDRLQRLNQELLAEDEEYIEEEYEEEYGEEEDLSDLDILLEEDADEQEEEILFCRNHANGYGKDIRNYANHYGRGSPKEFDDDDFEDNEDLEDEEFLYRDDYRRAKRNKRAAKKARKQQAPQQSRKKGRLGLAIIALVELIAICGIIAWWISWLV